MLDKETKDSIKYLALCKQKEQIEKEIQDIKAETQREKYGIDEKGLSKIANYFKD